MFPRLLEIEEQDRSESNAESDAGHSGSLRGNGIGKSIVENVEIRDIIFLNNISN
jgi:hypothetical protein